MEFRVVAAAGAGVGVVVGVVFAAAAVVVGVVVAAAACLISSAPSQAAAKFIQQKYEMQMSRQIGVFR